MKVLIVAYYEFIKNIRDIKMIGILIIFPILSIYILGNAVEGIFINDVGKKISVGYVNLDDGVIGKGFNNFLGNNGIKEKIEIISYSTKNLGEVAIEQGEIDGMIYLAKNLSERILKGDRESILLYGKKNVAFIESLTSGFVSSYNTLNIVSQSGNITLPSKESSIKRISYTKNSIFPRVIDYYTVLTLLQIIGIGAILGIFITSKIHGSDIHIRIHSLPVSRWSLITGRIIGSTTYLFVSSIVVMIFTKYVYHSNWDGNLLIILGSMLLFCTITIGIGLLIGIFVPSFSTGLMIVLLLMNFFGIISGAITPASTNEAISFLSPNFHVKILLFGTIYGYSKGVMIEAALWLLGFLISIYGIAAIFIRRCKNDNI